MDESEKKGFTQNSHLATARLDQMITHPIVIGNHAGIELLVSVRVQ